MPNTHKEEIERVKNTLRFVRSLCRGQVWCDHCPFVCYDENGVERCFTGAMDAPEDWPLDWPEVKE